MNIKKVKTLKYGQIYVDYSKLYDGVYMSPNPIIYSADQRIDNLVLDIQKLIEKSKCSELNGVIKKKIEALEQCTLETEFLIDQQSVEFIGDALNAYYHAGLDKLNTTVLGDIQKEILQKQVERSKELLKLFELTK